MIPLCRLSWVLTGMEGLLQSWYVSRSSIRCKHQQLSPLRIFQHWFPHELFPWRFPHSSLQSESFGGCCSPFCRGSKQYGQHHQWRKVYDIPPHWRWNTSDYSKSGSNKLCNHHWTRLSKLCCWPASWKRNPENKRNRLQPGVTSTDLSSVFQLPQ